MSIKAWAKEVVSEAIVPAGTLVDHGLDKAEAAAGRVVDKTMPKVQTLLDGVVGTIERRARVLVQESLSETYGYVDRTLHSAEDRLAGSIESAGQELRASATEAVVSLEAAVARTLERIEQNSLARLEETVTRALDASIRNTRREAQEAASAWARIALGLLLPVPAVGATLFSLFRPAGATGLAQTSLIAMALLVASTLGAAGVVSGKLYQRATHLARTEGEAPRVAPTLPSAVAEFMPFTFAGLMLVCALLALR